MASTRLYSTIAVVGVASLLGQYGALALLAGITFPIDKLVDAAFAHQDRAKRKQLKTLCGCIADELTRLVPGDEVKRNSVEIAAAKILDTHGPTDRAFVEDYHLQAANVVRDLMAKANLGKLDRQDIGEAIKQVLICFYERLPEQHELFADLLPYTHRALLKITAEIKGDTGAIRGGIDESKTAIVHKPGLMEEQRGYFVDRFDRLEERAFEAAVQRYQGELAAKDQTIVALQAALAALTENARKHPEDSTFEEAVERAAVGDLDDAEAVFAGILDWKSASVAKRTADAEADRLEAAAAARHLGALSMFENVEKALAAYQRAAALDPSDFWTWIFIARLQQSAGSLGKALSAAEEAKLHANDERETSVALNEIGDVCVAQGDLDGALRAYEAGLGIAEELAGHDPGIMSWQRDLSMSHNKIGDVCVAQGDLDGAVHAYEAGLGIREKLAGRDPGNSELQRDLSVSHNKIGDVCVAQGDLGGAVRAYEAGLEIRLNLLKGDPGNKAWMRDLSVNYSKIGVTQEIQCDYVGAMESFEKDLEIATKLADSDPSNANWQRDLTVSYNKVGDVRLATDDFRGALDSYQASYNIRRRLADLDPDNLTWQRDLSFSLSKIVKLREMQGDLEGAPRAYEKDTEMVGELVVREQSNIEWRGRFSVNYGSIGNFRAGRGDYAVPTEAFENGSNIWKESFNAGSDALSGYRGLAADPPPDFHKELHQKESEVDQEIQRQILELKLQIENKASENVQAMDRLGRSLSDLEREIKSQSELTDSKLKLIKLELEGLVQEAKHQTDQNKLELQANLSNAINEMRSSANNIGYTALGIGTALLAIVVAAMAGWLG